MRLICGYDQIVAAWVAERIENVDKFEDCAAIGVAPDDEDVLLAGVVFHEYKPVYQTIEASLAADTPAWARRGIIKGILYYPFEQLKVNKLWSVITADNKRAIKFNLGIGFTQEAILAHHAGPGKHALITRMLAKDYRRLYKEKADETTVPA